MIELASAFARVLSRPDEAIGLAGLNRHASENRLFADEDADILAPAVAAVRDSGINVHGRLPADALMFAAVNGRWKMVVVYYHDQGHAPLRLFTATTA